MKKTKKSARAETRIAVIDFETDPFEYGADIQPFAAGFFDGVIYREFWGDGCVGDLVEYLDSLDDELIIYAHNGGKFDFMFLLYDGHLDNPVQIIGGRIVSAKLGKHTLRDSFSILPVPLKDFAKDNIDYALFKRHAREKHRREILHYLAKDCEYLWEFVTEFWSRFGKQLTVASTAYKQLKQHHPQDSTGEKFDDTFRPYYFGGRVECIEAGELVDDWKVYDVNSMYPYVMREFDHPYSGVHIRSDAKPGSDGRLAGRRGESVYFAEIVADSVGALPVRTRDGIEFPTGRLSFFACSHEIQAGIETGRLQNIEYGAVYVFPFSQRFDDFVDTFAAEKIAAKESGDKTRELFAKLMLNSSYGKFGQNPRKYHNYHIVFDNQRPPEFCVADGGAWVDEKGRPWELYADHGACAIWRTPAPAFRFNNVATAASITSAARSVLLRALAVAERPVYCDTDSIICRGLPLDLHASRLGAWKLEADGSRLYVAGKKLYALDTGRGENVKLASKGVRLTPEQIRAVVGGQVVTHKKDSPAMGLKGVRYVERGIRRRV